MLKKAFVIFAIIITSANLTIADLVLDQQQTEIYYGCSIDYYSPIGQEFKPTLPLLKKIEIHITGPGGEGPIQEISINIREDGITGTILDTSSVIVPYDFDGWAIFDLNISVTPNDIYVFEILPVGYSGWGVDGSMYGVGGTDPYPRGRGIQNGNPKENFDTAFKTYGLSAELTGYVKNALTEEPLIMAWDYINNEFGNTVCSCLAPPGCVGPSGEYKSYPPVGLMLVKYCCDGYECKTKSIEIVEGQNWLDFELNSKDCMATLEGYVIDSITKESIVNPHLMISIPPYKIYEDIIWCGTVDVNDYYRACLFNTGLVKIRCWAENYIEQSIIKEIVEGINNLDFELIPSGLSTSTTTTINTNYECPPGYPIDCENDWCCSIDHPYYGEIGEESYKMFICSQGRDEGWCININASTCEDRHCERDFWGSDGSGYVTVDVTDKIVFKITVTDGSAWFCFTPESIVQSGNQYDITWSNYPDENEIQITWENFDGCGDIYEGITATGTMSLFPSSFNLWGGFRIYCGIWEYNDYFDIGADSPPTTSTISLTSTSIIPTTSIIVLPTTTTTRPNTTSTTTTTVPRTTTSSSILSTTTTVQPVPETTTTTADGGLCLSVLLYGERSEETELLRYIRDEVLSKTPEGREIIKLYYELSPAVIKAMEEDEDFREDVKEMIDGVLGLAVGESIKWNGS